MLNNKTVTRWQSDFLHGTIRSLVTIYDNKENITITLDGESIFKDEEHKLADILENVINKPIEEVLASDDQQIRMFGLLDKRCGKKKILSHKTIGKNESDVLCVRKYVTV